MLLICDNTVFQTNVVAKRTPEHLAQQVDIILFQVLVHKRTGYLYQQRAGRFVERLVGDGLKPCIILLLGNILTDERKGLAPSLIRTYIH